MISTFIEMIDVALYKQMIVPKNLFDVLGVKFRRAFLLDSKLYNELTHPIWQMHFHPKMNSDNILEFRTSLL